MTRDDIDIIEYAEKCAADATVIQDGETYWHSVTRLSARDVLRLCELTRTTLDPK